MSDNGSGDGGTKVLMDVNVGSTGSERMNMGYSHSDYSSERNSLNLVRSYYDSISSDENGGNASYMWGDMNGNGYHREDTVVDQMTEAAPLREVELLEGGQMNKEVLAIWEHGEAEHVPIEIDSDIKDDDEDEDGTDFAAELNQIMEEAEREVNGIISLIPRYSPEQVDSNIDPPMEISHEGGRIKAENEDDP